MGDYDQSGSRSNSDEPLLHVGNMHWQSVTEKTR